MSEDKQKYYGNEAFESIYQRMQEQYAPQLISYTPLDEKTLAERISAVLRPVYEKAISALFRGNRRSDAELDADEEALVAPLRVQELSFEELAAITGFPAAKLNSHLTILELRGIIEKVPGGLYRSYT